MRAMDSQSSSARAGYSAALTACCRRVATMRERFAGRFPSFARDGRYRLTDNVDWLPGFWPGMLWLTYAAEGDGEARACAESLLSGFADRLREDRDVDNHDLGFLYSLSARAQSQLGGDRDEARRVAIAAGHRLARRFREKGAYLQAWGPLGDPAEGGRAIIDTLMNLPLLWWTARETDERRLHEIAHRHLETTRAHLVRPDASTYHTFFFDQDNGGPRGPRTHQGHADDSLWARGQAWAIYGFTLAAEWCQEPDYRHLAGRLAERFLAELPDDGLPTWDLRLSADAPAHLDSSAAAIAAGGMLRLARLCGGEAGAHYRSAAAGLFDALLERCFFADSSDEGLLRHGNYSTPHKRAVDDFVVFGDYFFLETLCAFAGEAPDFWGPLDTDKEIME